jgi:hypothetical protein
MAQTATTGLIHMVYFWPREGAGPEDAAALAEGARRNLSGIPGVLRLAIGRPAGTERAVVDNSYGVALLVEFADAAAEAAYQVHPDHVRFVEECSRYWSRV